MEQCQRVNSNARQAMKDGTWSTDAPTGSSGLKWSCLETLRLCDAHRMSRDFLRVSSILHAAKREAAAAS